MFVPPFVPNLSVLSFVPNLSVSMARAKSRQVANDLTKAGCKWPETFTRNFFVVCIGIWIANGPIQQATPYTTALLDLHACSAGPSRLSQDGLETTTGAACRTDEEVVMRKMQFQSNNISKSRKHVP